MAAEPGPELTPLPYGHFRTSHADRERAVDVLKAAFAEGRLDQDEYTERVGQAQASRTYAELAALTADLPVGPLGTMALASPGALATQPASPVPAPPRAAAEPVSILAVVSLIFGLVAVAIPGVVASALVAMLTSIVALLRIGLSGQRGRGLALTGGSLGLLALLVIYLYHPYG
jgi:Domain of unknown function (DUF1707)